MTSADWYATAVILGLSALMVLACWANLRRPTA